MISNRTIQIKIPTIYFVADIEAFNKQGLEYVYAVQNLGSGQFHCDDKYIIQEQLSTYKEEKIILLQYIIPTHKQEKLQQAYADTKKYVPDYPHAFTASTNVSQSEIISFDYYAGYWEHIYNYDTKEIASTFYPCDPSLKQQFIASKQLAEIDQTLEKKEEDILSDKSRVLLGTVTSIALIAYGSKLTSLLDYGLVLGGMGYLSVELNKFENKHIEIDALKKARETIVSKNSLFTKNVNKTPIISDEPTQANHHKNG